MNRGFSVHKHWKHFNCYLICFCCFLSTYLLLRKLIQWRKIMSPLISGREKAENCKCIVQYFGHRWHWCSMPKTQTNCKCCPFKKLFKCEIIFYNLKMNMFWQYCSYSSILWLSKHSVVCAVIVLATCLQIFTQTTDNGDSWVAYSRTYKLIQSLGSCE